MICADDSNQPCAALPHNQTCEEGGVYERVVNDLLQKWYCKDGRMYLHGEEPFGQYRHSSERARGLSCQLATPQGVLVDGPTLTLIVSGGLGNQMHEIAMLLTLLEESRCQLRFAVRRSRTTEGKNQQPTYWDTIFHSLDPILIDPAHLGGPDFFKSFMEDWGEQGYLQARCVITEKWDAAASDLAWSHGIDFFNALNWPVQLAAELTTLQRIQVQEGCRVLALLGNYMHHQYYIWHLPMLRHAFWHGPSVERAQHLLANITKHIHSYSTLVALHVRLPRTFDFQGRLPPVLKGYYARALHEVQRLTYGVSLTCVVFSSSPLPDHGLELDELAACEHRVDVPPEVDDVASLYMMSLARVLIIAVSSLSYWAALLGPHKLVLFPDVEGNFDYEEWGVRPDWAWNSVLFGWVRIPVQRQDAFPMTAMP